MSNFCWSMQFKLTEDEWYEKSDVKLIYVGHQMYVKLKHIHQPWPQVSPPKVSSDDASKNKPGRSKRNTEVTDRGDKPKSKWKLKESKLPPLPPWPQRRSCHRIDYLELNDGLETPVVILPKPKHTKPYSPPLRSGPSVTRQVANKWQNDKNIDFKNIMESTWKWLNSQACVNTWYPT